MKEESPETITFTNFQLDMMKGQADLTGTSYTSHWALLDDFDGHVDAFAFTAYPFLQHKLVSDIPNDYLLEIRDYTNLPIIITETGWPSQDTASLVTGSDQAQIDYMILITEFATDINTIALMWVLPHDGDFGDGGIFDNISLFANDGQAKVAYDYWKAVFAKAYNP